MPLWLYSDMGLQQCQKLPWGLFFFFCQLCYTETVQNSDGVPSVLKMYFVSISTADLYETSIDVNHNKW